MDRNFPEGVDESWRHGRCYAMAKALTDLLGWPVATLAVTLDPGHRSHFCSDHVVHAWVRAPDGRGFDAGGFFDEADLPGQFLERTGRKFSNVRIEEFADRRAYEAHLEDVFGSDPHWARFAPDLDKITEEAMEVARDLLVPVAEAGVAAPRP